MATCGYLCPVCEGRGFKEDGSDCDWCQPKKAILNSEEEKKAWIKNVHEGPCCSDFDKEESPTN